MKQTGLFKINPKSYAGAFFLPISILLFFKILSGLHIYPAFHDLLSFFSILLCGAAGLSFYMYLRHSGKIAKLPLLYQYALSLAYALSSYALINSNSSFSTFVVYILLPVLFLFLEFFIYEEIYAIPFAVTLAAALCFDTVTSCILVLYFLLYLIIFSPKNFGHRIIDLLHLAGLTLFAILVSAAFSVPNLKAFFSYVKEIPYPNFSVNDSLSHFISRFFPGTFLGIFYHTGRGLDLYCAMGFAFLFLYLFFIRKQSIKNKAKQLFFVLLVIGTLELTPLQHLIELCSDTNASDIYYGFFFVFYLLHSVACDLPALEAKHNPIRKYSAILMILAFTIIGIYGTYPLLPQICTITVICFAAVYISLLIFQPYISQKKLYPYLLPVIIIAELCCSLFINTDSRLSVSDSEKVDNYPKATPLYLEEYEEYYKTHTANQLYEAIRIVNENVELTDAEVAAAYPYGIMSSLEEFQLKMQKIGIQDRLFTPITCSFTFSDSDFYQVYDTKNRIYNLSYYPKAEESSYYIVPFTCEIPNTDNHARIILYNNVSDDLYELNDRNETGYLRFYYTGAFNINFILEAYEVDDSVLEQIAPALEQYTLSRTNRTAGFIRTLLPFLGSCLGVLLLLYLTVNPDKEAVFWRLQKTKNRIASCGPLQKLSAHIYQNRIYYLAFLIPFGIYLTAIILYSSEPFGSKTFLDQDGYASVLGTVLEAVYPYQEGNFLLSHNGGFYVGVFPGVYSVYHMLLALFPVHMIPGILVFTECILIGLCGFSVCYYLTHRYIAARADKNDIRLLIPALIYSLNTYMIAMHSYVYSWYILYFLLPLLALALERMLYEKKWLPYLLLLAVCIGTNINISLYICVYLALHFFLCRFESIWDFIKKGLLFGSISLFGALCSFVNVLGVSSGRSATGYAASDSIKPTPGFYMSFPDQWKKFMFLTDYITTSENRGELNLYMGCLTLALCLFFFLFGKRKRFDKIRLLTVSVLLLLSFNGRILSYLWNGMHYPAGVPNRFVFLLMFVCALLSYDALSELKELSALKAGICFGGIALFVILVQILSSGNTVYAFVLTLVLLALYLAVHVIFTRKKQFSHLYYPVLISLFALEIAFNTWYNCGNIQASGNDIYGDFEAIAKTNQRVMDTDPSFSRFTFPATYGENFGFFRNTPTLNIFTSYLGLDLQVINNYYGFNSGANFLISNSDATPFGLSLSNTEFIQIPMISALTLRDLDRYEYVGYSDDHYIFRNPDVLSLGIFVPAAASFSEEEDMHPIDFANEFSKLYQTDKQKDLFCPLEVELSFLDKNRNPISIQKATEILDAEGALPDPIFASKNVYLSVSATPDKSGYVYLYKNEFVSLGYHEAGEPFTVILEYPNKILPESSDFLFCILDEEVYREFIRHASSNQLEQVIADKNKISAVLDYEEDGYTMLSLPYSGAWNIYIDRQPAEMTNVYQYFLGIKTPKGKHTLEMVYDFGRSIRYNLTILCLIVFVIGIAIVQKLVQRKRQIK